MNFIQLGESLYKNTIRQNSLIDITIVEALDVNEPLTLDEVKAHIRVDFTDDDDYITMLIKTARATIEEYTGLSLVDKAITLYCNNTEGGFTLLYGPVIDTPTVTDADGVLVTDATFSGISFKKLLAPCYSEVRLEYNVGFTLVPADLKMAILHEVAYLYEHRGDESDKEGLSPIAKGYAKRHRRVPSVF